LKKYRFIDHTGDLGVEIFGQSLPQLFQHAAEAFTEIVTDPKTVLAKETREIFLQADSTDNLLIRWLNEFVYMFDTRGLLFADVEIQRVDEGQIRAKVRGEPFDENRHEIRTIIKSATYHQLKVSRKDGIWKALVILDI